MPTADQSRCLEEQIDQWRSYLRRRQAIHSVDVAELEDHLREQVGGLIPLWPYMLFPRPTTALAVSAAVTLVALVVFGYIKGRLTGAPPGRGALQTALIGGLAASAAFAIARMIA